MIESRYNFWGRTPDGADLLFNGRTGALLELEPGDEPVVRAALAGCENEATPLLRDAGCIVPDEQAERDQLLTRLSRASDASPILELTISPTYSCNFRCTYCYVDFEDRRMTPQAAARVIKYVEQELPRHPQANITWFGGEPLQQWRLVADMAAQLAWIGNDLDRSVFQFLTTNGYLLTPEVTDALVCAGIRYFHVTIDGADSGQNQRRVLRNGAPTYRRVLGNLISLLGRHSDAHATLRMNLEMDSIASAPDLLAAIPVEYRSRVQVHATPVIREGVARPPELHRGVAQVITLALALGYRYYDNAIPVGRERHCTAESASTFQVGPDGELHKCSPSGKPEVTVGSLDETGLPVLDLVAVDRWRDLPGLPDSCVECRYLCFCGGGCRYERLRGTSVTTCRDQYEPMQTLVLNRWLAAQQTV